MTQSACLRILIVGWLCLASAPQSAAQSAPEAIEDAIAIVAKITHPDPHTQDELRAMAAFNMVRDRVKVVNDLSGAAMQGIPFDLWNAFTSCGTIKERAEALQKVRERGWDLARASWLLQAGACDENSSLMQEILTRAGVNNVKVFRSGSPHAFPVLGLAPDADPDIPWTWGPNAFVPDTWNGKFFKIAIDPEKIWEDQTYFDGGRNFVSLNAYTTTRELLIQMVDKGVDFIKKNCDPYRTAMTKFMRIPAEVRVRMAFQPPKVDDVCGNVSAWAGNTWYSDGGRAIYDVKFAGNVLAITWTYDSQPEGEFYDCKMSGAAVEIADCKFKQLSVSGTVRLIFKKEDFGDRVTAIFSSGADTWEAGFFRER